METRILHNELIERKQKLEQVRYALKEKFLGLDEIIEEVISIMTPWYIFPECHLRPTIINLWGLTGSGKTALVYAIVEMFEYRRLYAHIDMGEFESDSASWMKSMLTYDLEFFHGKSALICLDEFQFANTLDSADRELGKDKLRVLWDLLDTGKIEYLPNRGTYYLFRADSCLKRLEKAVRKGVELDNGMVVTEFEPFKSVFDGYYFEYDRTEITSEYFLSDDFVDGMFLLFDDEEYTKEVIRKRICGSSIRELIVFVKEGMSSRPATRTLDLSRALIFVVGNLDEAYAMSRNMNPDINADEFHEQTSKITIADIKRALRKRFRPEQIARLGNNHIVYRSFNSSHFRMLIRSELKRISDFAKVRFGWRLTFDESVVDIVYAEGVFPAQGTRPVLTTVKNLIESRISSLAVSILEYQLPLAAISWSYEGGSFTYKLLDESNTTISTIVDPAKLKLENLRKSVDPQIQAHTAVHEAGHAVLAALTFRIIPSVVVSRTASDMDGFCLINFPKGPITRETLRKDIVVTLGGFVAEKMIFGEDFTSSGVYVDLEEASSLANKAIRFYGMGKDPIHLAVESPMKEEAFFVSARYESEAINIIKECEVEATELLRRNKLLLLKVAEHLTTNSRMEEDMIKLFVEQYSVEAWVKTDGFIAKEQYYSFNKIVEAELLQLQQGRISVETVTDEIVRL